MLDINKISKSIDLPSFYVESIYRFLERLVMSGLRDRNSAKGMISYKYQLNEVLSEKLVNYYFDKIKW